MFSVHTHHHTNRAMADFDMEENWRTFAENPSYEVSDNGDGYSKLTLTHSDQGKSVSKTHLVARMVLVTFSDRPEGDVTVSRNGDDKMDDRLCKLSWATRSEQSARSVENLVTPVEDVYPDHRSVIKEIPGFPGYYASSCGLIKMKNSKGKSDRWRKGTTPRCGYIRMYLNGDHRQVHTLIAHTFLGPCPADMIIDHIDENKTNNRSDNLHYLSRSDNNKRSAKKTKTSV